MNFMWLVIKLLPLTILTGLSIGCGDHVQADDPVSWFAPGAIARLKVRIENRSTETLHYRVSMSETLSENRCEPYHREVENDLAPGQSGIINLKFNCRYAEVSRYVTVINNNGVIIYSTAAEVSSLKLVCSSTYCEALEY